VTKVSTSIFNVALVSSKEFSSARPSDWLYNEAINRIGIAGAMNTTASLKRDICSHEALLVFFLESDVLYPDFNFKI
jgi:hypothetical protein